LASGRSKEKEKLAVSANVLLHDSEVYLVGANVVRPGCESFLMTRSTNTF
jgi:hypothetical protein